MPVIQPYDSYSGTLHPLVDGPARTIGWQWHTSAKDGPSLILLSRRFRGSYKVLDRFPMTGEGWAQAWRRLVSVDPDSAEKVEAGLWSLERQERQLQRRFSESAEIAALNARSLAYLHQVSLLGGHAPGVNLVVGETYDLRFLDGRLAILRCDQPDLLMEVPYTEVEEIEIGGPGLVKTGGGFVGGGFGVVGAMEGMAIAAVLNALTTRSSIKTVLRVQATASELFLLYGRSTPEKLRIDVSRALAAVRVARARRAHGQTFASAASASPVAASESPVAELSKLAEMLQAGLLTREEFEHVKTRLLQR